MNGVLRQLMISLGFQVDKSSEQKVNSDVDALKNTIRGALGKIGISLSVAGLTSGIKQCVELASNVEQMEQKFNVVFGSMSEEVDAWAQDYADKIGRNKNDLKTYVSDQQNLLVGFTDGTEEARAATAEMAKQMTTAALDLASFSNINETYAVNNMTKAVMGESECAKSLDAVLNDVTREQAMYELGIEGTYNQLDQMSKMQVNFRAIMDQSKDSIGDCERSMGSYESTMRQFNAKTQELKETIGMYFLPIATKLLNLAIDGLKHLRDWIEKLTNFIDKMGGAERVLKILAGAVGAIVLAMNAGKVVNFAKSFLQLAIAKAPLMLILGLVLLLALVVEDFFTFMRGGDSMIGRTLEKSGIDVDGFREKVQKAWDNIKTALGAVWDGIQNVWGKIQPVFSGIGDLFDKIVPHIVNFVDNLVNGNIDTEKFERIGEVIGKIAIAIVAVVSGISLVIGVIKGVNTVIGAVKNGIKLLTSPVGLVVLAIIAVIAIVLVCIKYWDKIKAAFLNAWEAIKNAWGAVCDFFKGIWDGIVNVFNGVVDWFSNIFNSAWEAVKNAFTSVGDFFQGVWDAIVTVFSTIGDAISGAVKGAINSVLSGAVGIINGFISAINFAISFINKIPGVNIKELSLLEAPQLAQGGYVRPNNPMPVIIGDNKREGEIVSPISKMKGTVISALESFASDASAFTRAKNVRGSSAALAAGTTNSTKNVTQNVNINNQFNGDRAGQLKSSEAMNKASDDVITQMARAMAVV